MPRAITLPRLWGIELSLEVVALFYFIDNTFTYAGRRLQSEEVLSLWSRTQDQKTPQENLVKKWVAALDDPDDSLTMVCRGLAETYANQFQTKVNATLRTELTRDKELIFLTTLFTGIPGKITMPEVSKNQRAWDGGSLLKDSELIGMYIIANKCRDKENKTIDIGSSFKIARNCILNPVNPTVKGAESCMQRLRISGRPLKKTMSEWMAKSGYEQRLSDNTQRFLDKNSTTLEKLALKVHIDGARSQSGLDPTLTTTMESLSIGSSTLGPDTRNFDPAQDQSLSEDPDFRLPGPPRLQIPDEGTYPSGNLSAGTLKLGRNPYAPANPSQGIGQSSRQPPSGYQLQTRRPPTVAPRPDPMQPALQDPLAPTSSQTFPSDPSRYSFSQRSRLPVSEDTRQHGGEDSRQSREQKGEGKRKRQTPPSNRPTSPKRRERHQQFHPPPPPGAGAAGSRR